MNYVLLFIFILSGINFSSKPFNQADLMQFESFFAYSANYKTENKNEEEKTPEPSAICKKCNGSGKIKSGDGIFEFPCPDCNKATEECKKCTNCTCKDCKCVVVNEAASDKPQTQTVARQKIQVLYFGRSEYCLPCRHMKDTEFPKLIEYKWKFGKENDAHFREVVDEKEFAEYKVSAIPTIIRIEDGKITHRFTGQINYVNLAEFYYGRFKGGNNESN